LKNRIHSGVGLWELCPEEDGAILSGRKKSEKSLVADAFGKRKRSCFPGERGISESGRDGRGSEKGSGENLKKILSVLHGSRDIGANSGEPPGTFLGMERPGDLLLYLEHAKIPLSQVVRVRHRGATRKAASMTVHPLCVFERSNEPPVLPGEPT